MYLNKETEISYHYLQQVIRYLDEPLCLLGGWAVYFTVNSRFEKDRGRSYLGSRDIDLGFHDVKTMKKTMEKLEQLGFKRLSFRYFKELHTETMRELDKEEARKVPLHDIFPMYVDLIIAKTDASMKTKLGFMPVDEPLLLHVFEKGKKNDVKEFGKHVMMPSPSLLIAMKICSIKERDKEHKRIKDFCDLTALCLYSGIAVEHLKEEVHSFVSENKVKENLRALDKADYAQVVKFLGIDETILVNLIDKLTM
ncbi:nucleotidyl transferase AbiEii/AbiGii toxin family protein [Candidatus Woesearchaeota archaeon]|nr:nucleotidyl transferase AbiEii/AbiGii toxin family protein [Candidatus Woesearchaeota archaeon]